MFRKSGIALVISAVTVFCVSAVPGGTQQMSATVKSNPGFEQVKSLAGKWAGTTADGKSAEVEYQIVSNGTAVMERLHPHDELEMITMYSADGNRVSVTHYCSEGNQPQMQTAAVTSATQSLAFHFVRATNLANPDAGHMDKLTLTLVDANHLTQEWIYVEKGKPNIVETFDFTRKS